MIPSDGPGTEPGAVRAEFAYDESIARAETEQSIWALLATPVGLGLAIAMGTLVVSDAPGRACSLVCGGVVGSIVAVGGTVARLRSRRRARGAAIARLLSDFGGMRVSASFDETGVRYTISDTLGFGLPWTRVTSARTVGAHLEVVCEPGVRVVVPLSALGENVDRVRALAATGAAVLRDRRRVG